MRRLSQTMKMHYGASGDPSAVCGYKFEPRLLGLDRFTSATDPRSDEFCQHCLKHCLKGRTKRVQCFTKRKLKN